MSRHRNRNISYEDLSDDEDLYGSYDNSYTDPSLEQYMAKNKDNSVSLSSYVGDKDFSEDDKLDACLDQIFDTLGDQFTEEEVIEAIRDANFNVEKAISYLLSEENEEDFFEMDEEDDDDNEFLITRKTHPQASIFKQNSNSNAPSQPPSSSSLTSSSTSKLNSNSQSTSSNDIKIVNNNINNSINDNKNNLIDNKIVNDNKNNNNENDNIKKELNNKVDLKETNNKVEEKKNNINDNKNNINEDDNKNIQIKNELKKVEEERKEEKEFYKEDKENNNTNNNKNNDNNNIINKKKFPSLLADILCTSIIKSSSLSQFLSTKSFSIYHPLPISLPSDLQPFDFLDLSPDDIVLAKQKEAFKDKKPSSKPLNPVASSPNIISTQKNTSQKQPAKPIQNIAKVNNNNINLNNKAKQSTPNLSTQKSLGEFKPIVVATPPRKELNRSIGSEGNLNYTPKKEIIQISEAKRVQLLDEIYTSLKEVKDHLSLVVIGHVDAGKSTLMGHFLYLLGQVDQRTIHRYQTDSKKIGKASFAFAWVLDENEEERARGVTIDVGVNYFETDNKKFTLLDAPGHRDFIPNMITGAAQADAAVLVLASTAGEFESGFGADGQTKEHALLIRSLGVEQLIVAVNKLDTVNWSQERFNDIVNQAKVFLKQAGFKENKLTFLPCSGLTGENLIERKSDTLSSWYSGTTLVQAIDSLEAPKRTIDAPFRMCISDVFKNQLTGITVAGKIECGFIAPSHNLMKVPGNEIVAVKSIRVRDENASWAIAGDNVEIGITGIDFAILSSGFFLCSPEKPMKVTSRFQAKILTLTLKFPLTKGASVLIQYQNVTEEANVTKLLQTINKSTGVVDKKFPRCLGDGVAALVEITTTRPICVELFAENKQYGRITLRDKGVTIASGVVTKLLKNKAK